MQGYRFLTLILVLILSVACSNLPKEHKVVTAKEGVISIPVSVVNDGKVHFYTYKKSWKRINFFIRTDRGGKLSTYFDACYTCYKKKKGYRIEGTDLVCNECGLKFRLADEVWENKACSPIMLKSQTDKEYLIIKTEDLEKGGKLF
ncbi:MAG: hypothetical protein COZ31_03420 [Nitrospirae bacterium CG_4_10_14_3_um_filter_44_29]|nr:DUF2318 domain-containing protein [Nitrospirota bacterium]OIO27147.1 MAG: hypothetical protein AUJ60_09785 [Nitrospirae bacterium CG1_02_44_142]PIP69825.1 MAG: hypothetical protein COW90_08625 [Nitrospirae bacterium CG22_combo_CG10-13_8_21_14_all_44_11]PIV41585.1 MAG: hypothetical protein COS28_04835 [Nitrospirae bacterium CG02_land_8_20_14_3_00_44_33]PIV66216.1 MAG: hypothetical protein COS10_07455 [Nitrospirae bacterium CG01_land_8_20_14_3_00_44_22]PIW90007.1 MAG: hypothetical protein COZ